MASPVDSKNSKIEDQIEEARARADLYQLLAEIFLSPQGTDDVKVSRLKYLVKQLYGTSVRTTRLDWVGSGKKERLLEDYRKLFSGPGKLLAPPYGSVYLERGGLVMGQTTADLVRRMEEEHLRPSPAFAQPPDHIGLELIFLAHLALKQERAIVAGDTAEAQRLRLSSARLIAEHPILWISRLTARIEGSIPDSPYVAMASLLEEVLFADMKRLEAGIP